MNTFYTLTDKNTEHTNSRSTRYATLEDARKAAKDRITRAVEFREPSRNASLSGVYILRAVEFLEPETPVVPPIRTTTLVSPRPPDLGSEYALGHNPAGLTNKQVGVGDGWRLLDEDEVYSSASAPCVDCWVPRRSEWEPENWGIHKTHAYRTRYTRAELAQARAAAARLG